MGGGADLPPIRDRVKFRSEAKIVFRKQKQIKGEIKKNSLNLRDSFCLISLVANMPEGWDIIQFHSSV